MRQILITLNLSYKKPRNVVYLNKYQLGHKPTISDKPTIVHQMYELNSGGGDPKGAYVLGTGGGDPSSLKPGVGSMVVDATVGTLFGSHVGSSVLPGSGEP
jgi:hypothetical protein